MDTQEEWLLQNKRTKENTETPNKEKEILKMSNEIITRERNKDKIEKK